MKPSKTSIEKAFDNPNMNNITIGDIRALWNKLNKASSFYEWLVIVNEFAQVHNVEPDEAKYLAINTMGYKESCGKFAGKTNKG